MTPRSYLFVPADRPERYAKALASGADAVIVDFEDAVAPSAKDHGRALLADWLAQGAGRVIVRINAADTPWFDDDLALVGAANVAAVMLPKAERRDDFARIPHPCLLPVIETAAGVDALREVARAPKVQRLVFGSIDLQADLGIGGDDQELLLVRRAPWRSSMSTWSPMPSTPRQRPFPRRDASSARRVRSRLSGPTTTP